jgi:hypothetical protein
VVGGEEEKVRKGRRVLVRDGAFDGVAEPRTGGFSCELRLLELLTHPFHDRGLSCAVDTFEGNEHGVTRDAPLFFVVVVRVFPTEVLYTDAFYPKR